MTFERPEAWWLLALAVPVVALHLHLRRRRLVEVSSLELWHGLAAERAGRGALRRVRDGLALALLLAALAALSGSAAGPVTGRAASPSRRLAIVLDASATMGTRTGPRRSRFDAAIESAVAAVARLAPQDEYCIWLATESPRVAVEPTRDRHLPPGVLEGPTLERPGLATTARLALRAAPGVGDRPASVLVLTDAIGAESMRDVTSDGVELRVGVVDGGRVPRNAGIVACDVDPSDPGRLLVRAATTDGPPAPRTLALGGTLTELVFDAEGRASATLPLGGLAKSGGLVEVRLEPSDEFAEDDAARLVLPPVKPRAVAVAAATPSPFLVEALRAMPDVADPERTTLVPPGASAAAFDTADVVIADGAAAPAGHPSLTFGGGGRVVEAPLLWGVGVHAVLAGVDLSPLRIERAALVDPAPGETTIVASAAGPVGVAGERDGVRHVRFGFRPDASTLPLEAAFPLLVRNALRWLARPSVAPRYVAAGEPMPEGDGAVAPCPPPGGPYALRTKSGAETVVRWIPPRGFRLAPETPSEAVSAAEAVASLPDRRGDADTRRRHAPWLAAAGAALLALGALVLGPRRAASTSAPPSTGTAWATSSRAAARSPRA